MISSLDGLNAEARAAVDACLERVGRGVDAEFREEVLDDLRAYFTDHLEPGATSADVEGAVRALQQVDPCHLISVLLLRRLQPVVKGKLWTTPCSSTGGGPS